MKQWLLIIAFALATMHLISKLPNKKEMEYLYKIAPHISMPMDTIFFWIECKYLPIRFTRSDNFTDTIYADKHKNHPVLRQLDNFLRWQFPQGMRPCGVSFHQQGGEAFMCVPLPVDHRHVWTLPAQAYQSVPTIYTVVGADVARFWTQRKEDRNRNPEIWKTIDERAQKGIIPVILPN